VGHPPSARVYTANLPRGQTVSVSPPIAPANLIILRTSRRINPCDPRSFQRSPALFTLSSRVFHSSCGSPHSLVGLRLLNRELLLGFAYRLKIPTLPSLLKDALGRYHFLKFLLSLHRSALLCSACNLVNLH
jgi:hypothetical protein